MRKIFLTMLFVFAIACNAWGAAFTSTQTGDWTDGGTWGNTSPGVEGTDWPGAAGDTATVASGHTVTYDHEDTDEYGDITVAGTLTFATDQDTKITFATAKNFELTNGGTLNIGTSGTPIPAAYTAEVLYAHTGAGVDAIHAAGATTVNAYGDPAYYGGDAVSYLADNADNTDNDDTIVLTEDKSAAWNVGDRLAVQREKDYGDTTPKDNVFGANVLTIVGITGTAVQLSAAVTGVDANPGADWTGVVLNLSRNVIFGSSTTTCTAMGASCSRALALEMNTANFKDVEFQTGLRHVDGTDASNKLMMAMEDCTLFAVTDINATAANISSFTWTGNDAICANNTWTVGTEGFHVRTANTEFTGGHFICMDLVFRTSDAPIVLTDATFIGNDDIMMDAGNGLKATNCTFACGNQFIIQYKEYIVLENVDIWGYNIVSNDISKFWGYSVRFWSNNAAILDIKSGDAYCYNCEWGWDSNGVSKPNSGYDVSWVAADDEGDLYCFNCKLESGSTQLNSYYLQDDDSAQHMIYMEHDNQVLNAHRTRGGNMTAERVPCDGAGSNPSEDPDAGSDSVLSVLADDADMSEHRTVMFRQRFWKPAGTYTVSYPVQSTYAVSSGFEMKAIYLDTAASSNLAWETDISAVSIRATAADWTQDRSATFTTGEAGWVTIEMYLQTYTVGGLIFIWPDPTWS